MESRIIRLAAPFVLSLAFGCGTADERPELTEPLASQEDALHGPPVTIKIGALDDPATTTLYGAAIRLAVQQMNQALTGLRSNVRFEVAFGDDQRNNPTIAKAEALRLLNDEHVLAMISDSSGDTIAVNELNYDPATVAPYQIPVVCYQCSNALINDPTATHAMPVTQAAYRDEQNWLFRIFYNGNFEAKVIDQIILAKPSQGDRNGDGVLKIAVYADPGHAALANAIGPTLGLYYAGATSTEVIVGTATPDYAGDWPRVVDTFNETTGVTDGEPDYVVLAMLPTVVTGAVVAYRAGGYTLPVISNNSFRRNYILPQIGAGANGIEGSSVALANSNLSGELFVRAFTAAYGQGPEQTSSGAYDSAATLMLASLVAARAVGGAQHVTPSDIRDGLTRINNPHGLRIRPSAPSFGLAALAALARVPINYDGAYDSIDWDARGDIFPVLVHWSVVNNAFVEGEAYQCNPANPLCPVR